MLSPGKIHVPFIDTVDKSTSPEAVSATLDRLPKNIIGNAPWNEFQYKPKCEFTIAHTVDGILLKYFVLEDDILVRFKQPNDLVYFDSCVEFFIAFNEEDDYYNIEFNSIGTCYLGYGSKSNRAAVDVEVVKKIKSCFAIQTVNGKARWELTVIIPLSTLCKHQIQSLSNLSAKANFYKCGDDLPVPHYLSWNNIESANPNFHQPDFFGELHFE